MVVPFCKKRKKITHSLPNPQNLLYVTLFGKEPLHRWLSQDLCRRLAGIIQAGLIQ